MEKSNAEHDVKTYIDIKSDWGFKKIFGTDENKQNLINFLNAFFAEEGIDQISDVTFTNKESQGDFPDERTILFDVICETEKGDRFIVEMQKYRQPDLADRIIAYLERLSIRFRKGEVTGGTPYLIPQSHIIAILDFNYWPFEDAVNTFLYKHKKYDYVMSYTKQVHYLELKKFPQSAGELNNMLEKWVYLFNNLTEMNGRPEVLDDECFDSVLSAAEYAALSEADRQKYDEAIMTELDYEGALEYAKLHGFEEGALQQQLKVLKNMLDRHLDDESIKAVLGVDGDLLLRLKSQL